MLSGVVSYATRWLGEQLTRPLRPDQLLLMVAKGMEASEDGDLRILPDVVASLLPEELRAQVPISPIVGPASPANLHAAATAR